MAKFNDRLKTAMEIRGYRQIDLAEKTNLNAGTINNYLSGKYIPRGNKINLLSQVLNVNPAWLLGYDNSMDRTVPFENTNEKILSINEYLKTMNNYQLEIINEICKSLIKIDNSK